MSLAPRTDPPDRAEMESRLSRVRAFMRAAGLTHYVAASPDNVFYLTNFANYVHERPFVLVASLEGPLRFVVPKLEIPHVDVRSVGDIELVEYFEFPSPQDRAWDTRLRGLFPSGSVTGVESTCPLQLYEALPGERVRHDAIEDARMVKSDYEIARIVYSSNVATEAMEMLLSIAKPGMGLLELHSQCRGHMILKALVDNPSTNMLATNAQTVFQPPSISHDPHNFTDVGMVMETNGPNVSIINGTFNGYGTEVERTFFLGDVPANCTKPFEAMMEARRTAYEMTVPGAVMSDVDRACNEVFRRAGYGENLLHRTGHSIGVTGHEGPFLADGDDRVIEPGMVFTIEPGVYIPGTGGFRHSDTVLVTEHGNESLTPVRELLAGLTLDA